MYQAGERPVYRVFVMAALARVQGSGAWRGTMLAFEFLVLTAARSGEVRNARWEQIDRAEAVWTIPAERMKAGREHRVPLSPRAIEVLDGAAELPPLRSQRSFVQPVLIVPGVFGLLGGAQTPPQSSQQYPAVHIPHASGMPFAAFLFRCLRNRMLVS